MGTKELHVEFNHIKAAPGVIDIAIRYDTKDGRYNFVMEENGLPTSAPMHVFNGILTCVMQAAVAGVIDGYRSDDIIECTDDD
jgi:predicted subunit of tRNA(5-methylaminomethyl-2-thiouridylate) methyltransferase